MTDAIHETVNEPVESYSTPLHLVRLPDRDAWFGATIAALFNAVGMLIEIEIIRKFPGVPTRPAELSGLFAVLLLIVLFFERRTPSMARANIIYSLTTISIVAVFLSINPRLAIAEPNWVPFQESKLGCLAAAMVAPAFGTGFLSIAAFSLSAILQFELFFPAEIKATVSAEPWPTIAFSLCGVLALVYRFRRAQLQQEVAKTHAQNAAISRLAHVFLDIRDRMNTPLQVIELSVDLLRQSNRPSEPILDRIDRSVDSLREINSLLVRHEKEIQWKTQSLNQRSSPN